MSNLQSFERTELRTLQNMCAGDNEKFLNEVAEMIAKFRHDLDMLKMREHSQTACIRTMTEEAADLIQENASLQRKVEQLQKKYNDFEG